MTTFSTYLDGQTNHFRNRAIPWEGYQRAALISEAELALLRTFDNGVPSDIHALLKRNGSEYALLFVNLLQRIVRNDTLQNILILIDDIIADDPSKAYCFIATGSVHEDYPYSVFLKLLSKDDEFVQAKAAKIVCFLLAESPSPLKTNAGALFTWVNAQLNSSNSSMADLTVQLLMTALSRTELRYQFWNSSNGMVSLVDLLKRSGGSAQMQYQCIYCLWSLSFEPAFAAEMHRKYDVILPLLDFAKAAIKEKVVRVIFSLYRNLLTKASEANLLPLLGAKVLPVTESLLSRKWAEQDIIEDLTFIRDELAKHEQHLSTFDAYSSEIRSGRLEWSPATLSENFWKQNAQRLNEEDHELLKLLARYLSTSTVPLVLAVACHDIGQYVKYYSAGKVFVQEIGAKQRIMELMTHENSDVRYQALIAVQKYMMNAWE